MEVSSFFSALNCFTLNRLDWFQGISLENIMNFWLRSLSTLANLSESERDGRAKRGKLETASQAKSKNPKRLNETISSKLQKLCLQLKLCFAKLIECQTE